MKRNPAAGTGKVCAFTLKQICLSKGWLVSTILIAALLLLGIPFALFLFSSGKDDSEADKDDSARISTVYVVDETAGEADYAVLHDCGYTDINYIAADDLTQASEAAKTDANAVILRVTKPDSTYLLTVCLPEDTAVPRGKAGSFADFAEKNFSVILTQKAGLSEEGAALLARPVMTKTAELYADGSGESGSDTATEILSVMLPFVMMMIMYMMVLLYAQSVGNSVILEKQSKLMETMLTAAEPFALMTGKMLAVAIAAILQILTWILAGIFGMMAGAGFAVSLLLKNEETAAAMQNPGAVGVPMFSLKGFLLAFVVILLGFGLYLALGAISGALASKAEDLAKTNLVFTMILVFSMLMCLNFHSEGPEPSLMSEAAWLNYFPFTAILVVPSKLILGQISIGAACISIAILVLTVILLIAAAAAVYKLLVLYRGTPPTPAALLNMLKENAQKAKTKTE